MNYIIALGSNLSKGRLEPPDLLSRALWDLPGVGLRLISQSQYYVTPAQPQGVGPDFVSVVVTAQSDLGPSELVLALRRIEVAAGDKGSNRTAARVLDLDLIGFGEQVFPDELSLRRAMEAAPSDDLILPHPQMHRRGYVLVPLAEVLPEWRHPILLTTAAEMLAELPSVVLEGIHAIEARKSDTPPPQRDVAE